MQMPSAAPDVLAQMLNAMVDAIAPLCIGRRTFKNIADNPQQVVTALRKLREIIQSDQDSGEALAPTEVTEIGEYAAQLLGDTSQMLQRLNDIDLQQQNGLLAVSIALWVDKNGGHINRPESLVDTLAWLANRLTDPEELTELNDILGKLIQAVGPAISHDPDNASPGHPWRVLNINRGIVATRTHKPEVMEEAFRTLINNLPQDAPDFFARGMSEMERVGYPQHVRAIMKKYYNGYNSPTPLH